MLNRVDAVFARANAHRLIYGEDEYFAVAEFARTCGLDDRFNRVFDNLLFNDDFDLQLGHEFDFVFTAAIDLGMAFLPTETFHFADRHSLHAERLQGVLDALEQVGTDDRFYLFHSLASLLRAAGGRVGQALVCPALNPRHGQTKVCPTLPPAVPIR